MNETTYQRIDKTGAEALADYLRAIGSFEVSA